MDDLIAFVTARLDEDEAAATEATPGPWTVEGSAMPYIVDRVTGDGGRIRVISGTRYEGESPAIGKVADAEHIVRHDPARGRREIAAKRSIVNNYVSCATADRYTTECTPVDHFQDGLGWALKQLAAVWNDHPDYRAEWLPPLS